jgi:hypothetical protein
VRALSAALAFTENGQKALAWLGVRIAINARRRNASIGNFGLDIIGKRGQAVRRVNTEMAYIQCI